MLSGFYSKLNLNTDFIDSIFNKREYTQFFMFIQFLYDFYSNSYSTLLNQDFLRIFNVIISNECPTYQIIGRGKYRQDQTNSGI